MRTLRNHKGFSLTEMLAVMVIVALILVLISVAIIGRIQEAREDAILADARYVWITGQFLVADIPAIDEDYIKGLSGAANDSLFPIQQKISEKMNALLAPGVLLSETPGKGTGTAEFFVVNGVITKLVYTAMNGSYTYAVTIVPGEDTTIERVGK